MQHDQDPAKEGRVFCVGTAIGSRMPAVQVEYDANGQRRRKVFHNDAYAARRLYMAKLAAGKNPKVIGVEQ